MAGLSLLGQAHAIQRQGGAHDCVASPLAEKDQGVARNIIDHVLAIHAALRQQADLRPGRPVDELLTSLVERCVQIHDTAVVQEVLADPGLRAALPSLQSMCARAECCLEAHWADAIAQGTDADDVYRLLRSFPYYDNYERLARLELCALCSLGPMPTRVAFIGSGPLPLTSLCLLEALRGGGGGGVGAERRDDVGVLNIDRDEPAIAASRRLAAKLGHRARGTDFVCAEAGSDAVDLAPFDVVYLAALVGASQAEKERLLIDVVRTMREGALAVVRTSWGLRTCLYSQFDVTTKAVLRWLDVCLVLHPYGDIVNSVIVARVKPSPDKPRPVEA
ncbi:hypothetical protein CDD83_4562 [Cordyceps sp. RAO-2017]|nr:hypothetical protein CDD83_4562 [Cordyceps sp. RAO-2017]